MELLGVSYQYQDWRSILDEFYGWWHGNNYKNDGWLYLLGRYCFWAFLWSMHLLYCNLTLERMKLPLKNEIDKLHQQMQYMGATPGANSEV